MSSADVDRFYAALTTLLRNYQFRDRDRQTICGISVTQCYALEFIVNERHLTISQIAERLVLNKSNASRVVDALEVAGLVSRERDPSNHRARLISATASGRRLHSTITRDLKRDYKKILSDFPASFVRDAGTLLESIAERAARPRDSAPVAPTTPTSPANSRRRSNART
ncbi:MAG TPA: MarR family transcriptional regulator [Gemmatimonadaceae bacterium]|nr:MarR family transcriptional regulator [Gemmatimonadaceae bacterium]